jgi:N-acetyl-alpha-D-muramate 1-phosphate uridylyltransferase
MKAMVLAAGRGERLRPLTDRLPKPLVDIGGEPLLGHQLRWLAAAGIREVVINLHHLGQQISDRFDDGGGYGIRITYSRETRLLETGGGIVNALPLLGKDPFVILNGDIFTDFPLAHLPPRLDPGVQGHLVVTPRPPYRERGDFDVSDGRVIGRGDPYVYCGIAILDPGALAGRTAEPFSLREVFFDLLARQALTAQIHHGYWNDIGTPEQLAEVQQRALHPAAASTPPPQPSPQGDR